MPLTAIGAAIAAPMGKFRQLCPQSRPTPPPADPGADSGWPTPRRAPRVPSAPRSGPRARGYHPAVRLIDSHCHLNADRFENDVDLVIGAARLAGVERILVPGWNVASSRRALALAERFDWLDVGVGVHPHDADKVDAAGWGQVVALAADPRVVAIGETGLDYDRVFSPIPAQLANLRRNLALARETGKPAILHCRSAAGRREGQDALVAALRAAGVGNSAWAAAFGERPPAIIHSYSGTLDYARTMIEMGLAVSFSGLVFRSGEEDSAAAAALVSGRRLLVETDSPFLSPPGAPRKRNEPEWVAVTASWLAQRRQSSPDAVGDALVETYDLVFGKPAAHGNRSLAGE